MTDDPAFESRLGQDGFLSHVSVHSEILPAYVQWLTVFPEGKAAGAWIWPLTSIYRGEE